MAKYKMPEQQHNAVERLLLNIANELADWNEMGKKMYELNKQQLELFKKQVEREESAKAVSDKELKDQENHNFFMEHIYGRSFIVQAPILGFVVGNPDQGIVAGQMLTGGIFNAALNQIRFELFSSRDPTGKYLGPVDLPIDQVRRDLCESKCITEFKD